MQAHLFQRQCHNDQDSRLEDWLARSSSTSSSSRTPSILCMWLWILYIYIKIHVVVIVSQNTWGFQTWDQTLCSSALSWRSASCGFDPAIWQRLLFFAVFRSHLSTPKFLSNRNIKTQGKRWSVAHRSWALWLWILYIY
jgi:hypothetical protein